MHNKILPLSRLTKDEDVGGWVDNPSNKISKTDSLGKTVFYQALFFEELS